MFAHYDVNQRSDEIRRYRRIHAFAFIFNEFPVISRDRTVFVPWKTVPNLFQHPLFSRTRTNPRSNEI